MNKDSEAQPMEDTAAQLDVELAQVTRHRDELLAQLEDSRAENAARDVTIASLRKQLTREKAANQELQLRLDPKWKGCKRKAKKEDFDSSDSCCTNSTLCSTESRISSSSIPIPNLSSGETTACYVPRELSVRDAVEEIQRWLFIEGGHLMGVEEMVTAYCGHVRSKLGIPLDRLFIGGLMLHPQVSAYVWKWELGNDFNGHEIQRDVFEKKKKMFSPDEPFIVLMDGRSKMIRMQAADEKIPKDCEWFRRDGYSDYIALPLEYRGSFVGAIGWSTKDADGFTDEEIELFERSLAALSTVMRLHTNDLVMKTLMGRLEDEVTERTRELAKTNEHLEVANKRVSEQASKQLKHFAMMSHEIRTPLHCLVAMTSLLLEDESILDDHHKDSLRMISKSGALLESIVNDILDYARLESGNVDIQVAPTNLEEAIGVVVQAMNIKGQARRQTIDSSTIDFSSLPMIIETDSNRLQQILYNLIGNALKFSENEGVVDLTMISTREDGGEVDSIRFAVKDHGKGIAKEDLAKIFDPFEQGSKETQRNHGGTGLGLAITQKLVKGLKGHLTVDSVLGEWTEFSFTLPQSRQRQIELSNSDLSLEAYSPPKLVSTVPPNPTNIPTERSLEQNTDIRILIADDNIVNQKILHSMLNRLGFGNIVLVENGQQAVEEEMSSSFQLILMDFEMPICDGVKATKTILAREREEDPPAVVFVTAHAIDSFREEALQAGGIDFICKPFDLQKIKTVVSSLGFLCPSK